MLDIRTNKINDFYDDNCNVEIEDIPGDHRYATHMFVVNIANVNCDLTAIEELDPVVIRDLEDVISHVLILLTQEYIARPNNIFKTCAQMGIDLKAMEYDLADGKRKIYRFVSSMVDIRGETIDYDDDKIASTLPYIVCELYRVIRDGIAEQISKEDASTISFSSKHHLVVCGYDHGLLSIGLCPLELLM